MDFPAAPAYDYKGVLQFTFTPQNGDGVTSDTITITDADSGLLKQAAALMVSMIEDNHPMVKAWRAELSKYVENHCA